MANQSNTFTATNTPINGQTIVTASAVSTDLLNLIQDYNNPVGLNKIDPAVLGAWASWTPTITVPGGTAPTYTGFFSSRYMQIGKTVFCSLSWYNATGGTPGAGTGILSFTLPLPVAVTDGGGGGVVLINNGSSNISGTAGPQGGTSTATLFITAGTALLGDGQNATIREIRASFSYETP